MTAYQWEIHAWLHAAMALICIGIAVEAFIRWVALRNRFFLVWAIAFTVTAIFDLVHGLGSVLATSPTVEWAGWSGFASRWVLVTLLYLGFCQQHGRDWRSWAMGLVVVLAATIPLWTYETLAEWLPRGGWLPSPPDAILTVAWVCLLALTIRSHRIRPNLPRNFALFVLLGVAAHATPAIWYQYPSDWTLWTGHGLRIAEYSLWLWVALMEHARVHEYGGWVPLQRIRTKEYRQNLETLRRVGAGQF